MKFSLKHVFGLFGVLLAVAALIASLSGGSSPVQTLPTETPTSVPTVAPITTTDNAVIIIENVTGVIPYCDSDKVNHCSGVALIFANENIPGFFASDFNAGIGAYMPNLFMFDATGKYAVVITRVDGASDTLHVVRDDGVITWSSDFCLQGKSISTINSVTEETDGVKILVSTNTNEACQYLASKEPYPTH